MLKILVYTNGKPDSSKALAFAAGLLRHLKAELGVVTVRSQTPPEENAPPIGVECPLKDIQSLPPGIQVLVRAANDLLEYGVLEHRDSIQVRYGINGYLFVCNTLEGNPIPFYERYGSFIEVLNREVTENHYDLLILSIPRRSRLGRFVLGDTARLLALDLHASFLVVRGGTSEGRYRVCADASPSARRIFPLLKELFPAIADPLDLVWVRSPEQDEAASREVRDALGRVMEWIKAHGRRPRLLEPRKRNPVETVLDLAGSDSVIVVGASLRHDLYRRMLGSFSLEVIKRAESSVLLVKGSQETDLERTEDGR